jgi:hypothetical protein
MSTVMKTEKVKKVAPTKVYSNEEKNKIVDKLITARIGLLLRQPL